MIQKPELYDVIVLPNLYGDIVSDLCAGLVGGLGVAPGANIGEKAAIFEATHGSAPKYKGQNKVNPTALILSGVMMLRHIGKTTEADKPETAVAAVIAEGKNECMLLMSARPMQLQGEDNFATDRLFCVRTVDGGKSFNFVSWVVGPSDPSRALWVRRVLACGF